MSCSGLPTEHTPTNTPGKSERINLPTVPRPPIEARAVYTFCAHATATGALDEEDWFGTRGTAPVAKATARSEGQQREQSWIPDLGPAATSGTMACGLVL